MLNEAVSRVIGHRIRQRRRALSISQKDLAGRIGTGFQTVAKYESGEVELATTRLVMIARALDCDPGQLLNNLPMPAAGGRSLPESPLPAPLA